MLRRRANALGNSQGQVTQLRELSARTCDYGVSHWYPLVEIPAHYPLILACRVSSYDKSDYLLC